MHYPVLKRPLSPLSKNVVRALSAIMIVMTAGTVGVKLLTGWTWIDSFYFMSMVATVEGAPTSPPNFWSKIFVSIMSFVSIGALVTTIGVLFGPALGYLFQKGREYAEEEKLKGQRELGTKNTKRI